MEFLSESRNDPFHSNSSVNGSDQTMTSIHAGNIKAMLDEEGVIIRSAHFAGAGGSEVVQRRTGLIDRTLRDAYNRLSATGPMPALLAIGGYGRGELNPHSDIDIMFLCRDEKDRQRSLELLYILWDAGMDLGYSVRTVNECVSLARQDIKIRTSLLESRLLAGDPVLYDLFIRAMQSEVFYWKPSAFIQEKIRRTNCDAPEIRRFDLFAGTQHQGMRRRTPGYSYRVLDRFCAFSGVVARGTWSEKTVITGGQYAVFLRSRDFLWRVRNEIHYLSGRKNDHLTFDLQERTAKDFNYRDSAHLVRGRTIYEGLLSPCAEHPRIH